LLAGLGQHGDRRDVPSWKCINRTYNSRRRCALCFKLKGDLTEKRGQIAHLDRNPANYAEGNLAWLCLEHHSEYDSSTSQHKNYTIAEVKQARDDLYGAIRMHLNTPTERTERRNTDRQPLLVTFANFVRGSVEVSVRAQLPPDKAPWLVAN
jgi:hypothetical protein